MNRQIPGLHMGLQGVLGKFTQEMDSEFLVVAQVGAKEIIR